MFQDMEGMEYKQLRYSFNQIFSARPDLLFATSLQPRRIEKTQCRLKIFYLKKFAATFKT